MSKSLHTAAEIRTPLQDNTNIHLRISSSESYPSTPDAFCSAAPYWSSSPTLPARSPPSPPQVIPVLRRLNCPYHLTIHDPIAPDPRLIPALNTHHPHALDTIIETNSLLTSRPFVPTIAQPHHQTMIPTQKFPRSRPTSSKHIRSLSLNDLSSRLPLALRKLQRRPKFLSSSSSSSHRKTRASQKLEVPHSPPSECNLTASDLPTFDPRTAASYRLSGPPVGWRERLVLRRSRKEMREQARARQTHKLPQGALMDVDDTNPVRGIWRRHGDSHLGLSLGSENRRNSSRDDERRGRGGTRKVRGGGRGDGGGAEGTGGEMAYGRTRGKGEQAAASVCHDFARSCALSFLSIRMRKYSSRRHVRGRCLARGTLGH